MPAQTTHGYPYPVGTDLVADGDNAIQALAEKIETRLRGGVWSGVGTMPSIAANAVGSVVVTYPVGQFSSAPRAVATVSTTSPHLFEVGVSGATPSSITVYVHNSSTAAAEPSFYVIAQLQGGSGLVALADDAGPPPPPTVTVTVTCATADCGNAGTGITVEVPDGAAVVCGVCSQPITDLETA